MSKRADPFSARRARSYEGHKKPCLSSRRGINPADRRREQDAIDAHMMQVAAKVVGKRSTVTAESLTAARGGW